MSAKEKLLPCPFCGGEAHLFDGNWVECTKCGCQTPETFEEVAISAWNRRTPPVAVEAPLKWSDRSYGAEAITPFGSYRVYAADGLTSPKWSYCFDEYYDEDEFECDSIDQGKALAQAHWDERVRSIFQVRMISWQPIDTAPRDGTDVLLYGLCKPFVESDEFVGFYIAGFHDGEWISLHHDDQGQNMWIKPTHWMPLPAAPTETSDE